MDYTYLELSLETEKDGYAQAEAPKTLPLDGSRDFTVMAWVRFENSIGFKTIVTTEDGFIFGIQNQQLAIRLPGYSLAVSRKSLEEKMWHHVCVVYDKSLFRFYLNGQSDTTATAKGTIKASDKPLMFGKNLWGNLRNVSLYAESLSKTRIRECSLDNSGAAFLYDFTQSPAKEITGNAAIELKNEASIISEAKGADFSQRGFLEIDEMEDVNPAGVMGEPYTIQAWIYLKAEGQSDCYTILTNTDYQNTAGMTFSVEKYEDGYHLCAVHGIFEADCNQIVSDRVLNVKEWINVAVVFQNFAYTLYINGCKDSEKKGIHPMSNNLTERKCFIGSDVDSGSSNGVDVFSGSISRIDIWKRALTAQEISKYMDEEPYNLEEGLSASYRFFDDFVNTADFTPAGRKRGIQLDSVKKKAAHVRERKAVWLSEKPFEENGMGAPGYMLDQQRLQAVAQLKKQAAEEISLQDLESLRERLPEGADWQTVAQDIMNGWKNAGQEEDGDAAFYTVTNYRDNGKVYFVEHDRNGSRVVLCMDLEGLSDVDIWVIQLVFIIVGGLATIFFGLSIKRTEEARRYLARNITCMGILRNAFSADITPAAVITGIVTFISELYGSNKLKELLKIMFQLGFWALVRVCTTFVFRFLGGWTYWAVELGSLAVAVIAHILTYPGSTATVNAIPQVSVRAISFTGRGDNIGAIDTCEGTSMAAVSPEWRSSPYVKSCPAAYNMEELLDGSGKSRTFYLWVTFLSDSEAKDKVWIKGEDQSSGKLFGDTDAVQVDLSEQKTRFTNYIRFSLKNHKLPAKVCQYDYSICWKCSTDQKTWKEMTITQHKIYTLLGKPGLPWTYQKPWTSVLDQTYSWVGGADTKEKIAEKVTAKINDLCFAYDTDHGATHYVQPYRNAFCMGMLLQDIENAVSGKPYIVNCTDCANMVTIISNIWGCNMKVQNMYHKDYKNGFLCNEIYAIGSRTPADWRRPFDGGFSYHAVGIKSAGFGNQKQLVYDACLKVNEGTQPWSAVKKGRLPVGMPFSTIEGYPAVPLSSVDANSYREHLADDKTPNDGAAVCKLDGTDETAGCV